MSFQFQCPACGKQLAATEKMVGKQKNCPRCRQKFIVPSPPTAGQGGAAAGTAAGDSTEHPSFLFSRKSHKHEDLIDMTAMVDIVFFLLIFFLVTSMQALESVINLPTPQSNSPAGARTASEISKDPAYLNVTIEDGDHVFIDDDEAIGERDIRAKLRAAKAKDPDLRGMLITGSPDATHGTFVTVVDAGAEAGMPELLFTVREEAE